MNKSDVLALAGLLESLGFGFAIANAQGATEVANGLHASDSALRGATVPLSGGRQLTLGVPAAMDRRLDGDAESRFRLLAEHSLDLIIAVDLDLAIRYASPATSRLLGCAPNDLQGHTLAELLVPEERAVFIARHFTRAAGQGRGPDLFRALCRDGSTRWVEARVTTLPAGNGLGDYLVTLRDADQRHQSEATLGQANAELSALASTDALTGLPNRRQFDATLQKEWYRALRDGTPLGLLMIDIDHFKSLNDLFGHQVGDLFLARVGGLIRDSVRRAGDMAARFGGEEFSAVLPGTAVPGALDIAEVLRRAVAGCDFCSVVPGGYGVSVSIGVASMVPTASTSVATLVQNADAALYQAKRSGRNRVDVLR